MVSPRHALTANSRVLRSELRGVDAQAMGRTLERLDGLLKAPQSNEEFKQFLRETVHDYRPAGDNVVPISGSSKALKNR